MRVYLIYPYSIHGTLLVERFKASLREKYEVVDPFEAVGIGAESSIAERDMELIDGCSGVVAFLPCEGLQSGWELCYAYMKGKKVTIYIRESLIGPFINWMRDNGVEVKKLHG